MQCYICGQDAICLEEYCARCGEVACIDCLCIDSEWCHSCDQLHKFEEKAKTVNPVTDTSKKTD